MHDAKLRSCNCLFVDPHLQRSLDRTQQHGTIANYSNMIKTRVLIISDTHCASLNQDASSNKAPTSPFRLPLPNADLLIHCGDLTKRGETNEYLRTLDMLKQIDAPVKLVIAGNHDLSLDRDFVMSHRLADPYHRMPGELSESDAEARFNAARHLWTSPDGRASREGITFLDEGVHTIQLQNGTSLKLYASPYTPAFYDWGFSYEREEDRFNEAHASLQDARNTVKRPIPSRVDKVRSLDVVMTHGPPWLRLDLTRRGESAGCPHLLRAVMRARPLVHCFGHIHEGWGAERVRWTDDVAEVAVRSESIESFRSNGWKNAFVAADGAVDALCDINEEQVMDRHAVYVDLSHTASKPLKPGKHTAFINAAIMDVHNKPVNAPWLIDIDLPASKVT